MQNDKNRELWPGHLLPAVTPGEVALRLLLFISRSLKEYFFGRLDAAAACPERLLRKLQNRMRQL